MNELVGIIRTESELVEALSALEKLRERVAAVGVVPAGPGGRGYHPGWHLALDLRNMLLVSEAIAKAALEREESRGGHTREDFPGMNAEWRKVNLVCRISGEHVTLKKQPMEPMRPDLLGLFENSELKKYLTEEELPA
jgi:succinate dehydrogenase / fumarate reductase flavoprotein subunit